MTDVLSTVLSKRGSRFAGDNQNIALYYERSKNGNLVVFEVRLQASAEHGGFRLATAADTIDAYWLDLEPSYQAKARAKGKTDDREELNFIERWQGYGAKAENVEASRADVSFVALPSKKMTLTLEKNAQGKQLPVIRTSIGGKDGCILERIYVKSDESGWIPKVIYIDLHGVDPSNGAAVTERINP